MYDHQDGIIEIGSDGAFDLSDKPKVMVPPVVPEAKEPKNEKKLPEEWEIKKERGNKAFSSGHFELAIECYTSALECPLLQQDDNDMTLKLAKVSILANRALCYMKRAEEAEAVASSFIESRAWSPDSDVNEKDDAHSFWCLCSKDCEAALLIDPGNAKALYRHSRAQHALGNHMQAFSAARNAKRISSKSKEIVSWEAWLRALEAEREASMAATASAEKSFARGDGGQDAAGVAEQASLEATAAYLHVLGSTATHTNQAAGSVLKKDKTATQHWHHGPRDATEAAIFAASRGVTKAMASRLPQGSSRQDSLAKMCQDVAVGAARVAGGGLASLLPTHDPRRFGSQSRANDDEDENTPRGAGMRAMRATLSALLTPLDNSEEKKEGVDTKKSHEGIVSTEAGVQAGAAAAFFTAVMKGNTPSQAAAVAEYCLVRGAGLEPSAAKAIASNLSSSSGSPSPPGSSDQVSPFIASPTFTGAKNGYVFRNGDKGVGYYLDKIKENGENKTNNNNIESEEPLSFEEEALKSLLKALPNDEARESVKKLLKLPKNELKKLPSELQDHVSQLKDMYKQHLEFAKQSKNAEKIRRSQEEEKNNNNNNDHDILKNNNKSGLPSHNPRDGPPPSSNKELTFEEKVEKRRKDEMKWLEEFSEKNEKRRLEMMKKIEESSNQNDDDGNVILDRAKWEEKEALRLAEECRLKQVEDEARRAVAMQHVNELKQNNKTSTSSINEQTQQQGVDNKMGKKNDKKRKEKIKKEKKKERSGQFDDIRKLAASASEFQFS